MRGRPRYRLRVRVLAVRDSRKRVAEFLGEVPGITSEFSEVRLDGKSFIDVGANVGGMLFEFARRGAICTGVEYREDRVQLMRDIAAYYSEHGHALHFEECRFDEEHRWICVSGCPVSRDSRTCRQAPHNDGCGFVPDASERGGRWFCEDGCPHDSREKAIGWGWICVPGCLANVVSDAEFYSADFNCDDLGSPTWVDPRYDIVLCSAVDNYIDDQPRFYELLRSLVADGGIMYYECNVNRGAYPVESVVENMRLAGFSSTEHVGVGQDQFLRRKIYRVRP